LQTAHTETQQKLTSAQSELEKLQSTQNSDMKKAIENVRLLNGKIMKIKIKIKFVSANLTNTMEKMQNLQMHNNELINDTRRLERILHDVQVSESGFV
jgi:hypothetical protein